jgi:ATP-dependent DNA helicase RecQ
MDRAAADAAAGLLRRVTGNDDAAFRPGQLEAINALVNDRERVLVVQRTGWGKSAVYFIATRLLRDQGAGASLLISPLLALMRNQIEMAERAGVRAATINSANRDEWDGIEQMVRAGEVDLLLISPERLNNPRFRADVLPHLAQRVGMLIVDEAHCISDWGHDFRPDYRRVARVLDLLPSRVPVLCTTATANERVIHDVVSQLGDELHVFRGPLDRESLSLSVVVLPNPAARLAWLAREIPQLAGSGIVYSLTVRDTEAVAEWLRRHDIAAVAYSGASDPEHRLQVERDLDANRVKVVVATSALGMGYDKPDVGFVIHFQSPGSPIAYYQQVGRAGRSLDRSHGVLLVGNEDVDIQDYFIETAFPDKARAYAVLELLSRQTRPMREQAILAEVNIRPTRLAAMLKILEVEGALERVPDGGWVRTAVPWAYDDERVAQVTAARRGEQAAMFEYIRTPDCLMAFLRSELDDPEATRCGRCANCTGQQWDTDLDPAEVAAASAYLRDNALRIEPRLQWMGAIPGLPHKIADELRLEEGRALAVYNDGGWGSVVKQAKYHDHRISDELLDSATTLISTWAPTPAPEWLTWIPSSSTSDLVVDFAHRLASRLGLPALDLVARVRPSAPQKDMENSAQQLANVYGAFAVTGRPPDTPGVLVDDIFDSRWTLTVVGAALRQAGSGPVYPFALAQARST